VQGNGKLGGTDMVFDYIIFTVVEQGLQGSLCAGPTVASPWNRRVRRDKAVSVLHLP
jgi:hypothetical protein